MFFEKMAGWGREKRAEAKFMPPLAMHSLSATAVGKAEQGWHISNRVLAGTHETNASPRIAW